MAVMALETKGSFDPSTDNGIGFVGLIQFGRDAASDLGTTREDLKKMTALAQLDYVEKWIARKKDKITCLTDVYLSVLLPERTGKGSDKKYVLWDNTSNFYYNNPAFHKENGEWDNKNFFGKYNKKGEKIYKRGYAKETKGTTYMWEVTQEVESWKSRGFAKRNKCKTDSSTCEFGTSAGKDEGACPDCGKVHVDLRGDNSKWKTQPPGECYKTCLEILDSLGVKVKDRTHRIKTADQSGSSITKLNTKEGISYIDEQLEKGNPVIVGVDRSLEDNTYNPTHKATDHFVLIIGRYCDKEQLFYHFYEVGTKYKDKGISLDNTFKIENELFKGTPKYNSNNKYTVTEIRRNNE